MIYKFLIILGFLFLGFTNQSKADFYSPGATGLLTATTTASLDFLGNGSVYTPVSTTSPLPKFLATSTASTTLGSMTSVTSIGLIMKNNPASLVSKSWVAVVHCSDGAGTHTGQSDYITSSEIFGSQPLNFTFSTPVECNTDNNFNYLDFEIQPQAGYSDLLNVEWSATNINIYENMGYGSYLIGLTHPEIMLTVSINIILEQTWENSLNPPSIAEIKLSSTFPFAYYFQLRNILQNASSTTSSATPLNLTLMLGNSTSSVPIFSDDLLHDYLSDSQLATLKTLITMVLWVGLFTYFFARIKSLWQGNQTPE